MAGAKLDPLPEAPEFLDSIVPGNVPIAFTNPIFVDLDDDGFDPPGVPAPSTARRSADRAPEAADGIEPSPPRLSDLDPKKAQEVWAHQSVHRLRIPLDAVEKLREDALQH